jgi:hypothetical protein
MASKAKAKTSSKKTSTRKTSSKKSTSTQSTSARTPSTTAVTSPAVHPVTVSDENRRDETDAIVGRAATLHRSKKEGGDIEGEIYAVSTFDKEGYPDDVIFRPRNQAGSMISAKYKEIDALNGGFRGV